MPVFNPTLFTGALPQPAMQELPDFGPASDVAPQVPIQSMAPAPMPMPEPQKVFVPVPVIVPRKKKMTISPQAVRKAQGIYPTEQNQKSEMMDRATNTPTPTGAWGAPE